VKGVDPRGPALKKGLTGNKFGTSFSGGNSEMQAAISALSTLDTPSASMEMLPPLRERANSRLVVAQSAQELFSQEGLYDRMKSTAAQDGIPLDYMDRYAAYKQLSQSQSSMGGGGGGGEGKDESGF
jgi:hypothetical protein